MFWITENFESHPKENCSFWNGYPFFFFKLRFSKLNVTCEKKHLKCLGLDVIQNSSSPFYRLGVQTTI